MKRAALYTRVSTPRYVERVRAGMRRARLEGRHIGRQPLDIDRDALLRDRAAGHSLGQLASNHNVSRTTAARVLKAAATAVPNGSAKQAS